MSAAGRRLQLLRAEMVSRRLDVYLCHHNSDLFWLTGLDGVFDEEEAHFAFITEGSAIVHTDSRYLTGFDARKARGLAEGWVFTDMPARHSAFLIEQLGACRCSSGGILRIGIEDDLPLNVYRVFTRAFEEAGLRFEFVETAGIVVELRAVKDAEEIARLKVSQRVTDVAFAHVCAVLHPGMTELQAACELDFEMRRLGAQALAFPSIVAAGENAASPHSQPGLRVIGPGDIVLFDFGAKVDGYCSDMTRCVCMGEPTERQSLVYGIVLEAQTAAKKVLRAGVTGASVHAIAEDAIAEAGFGGCFGHGLGHGVGIDIHESPSLSPFNDRMLPVGAVVTVEPGIYLPNEFGIRIEDFGVVTEEGFETFTESAHGLVVIE